MVYSKERLDGFVLDIEFLLISVIQGIALTFLATYAIDPLMKLDFAVWPYIFSAFLFILLFWSQSIVHALSFIDWPLNLTHGFLYFLTSFLEVLAFSQINNPIHWFGVGVIFFIVAGCMYTVDLYMIASRKKNFSTPTQQVLYMHTYKQQKRELLIVVPIGILFTFGSVLLLHFLPDIFIVHGYYPILGIVQFVFTFLLLIISIHNFKKRAFLISKCME